MISTILYSKRFFPYYVYNILGGVDEQGKGGVYSFDPVGSYEREFCRAAGAAQSLLQPFLDSQVSSFGFRRGGKGGREGEGGEMEIGDREEEGMTFVSRGLFFDTMQ